MAEATGEGTVVVAKAAPASRPFSGFERMVAWRYLRSRRKEAFISVIAGFSFIGIMLGVATLIIVMAVMNGFRTELISRILGINGHMIVQPIDGPLNIMAVARGNAPPLGELKALGVRRASLGGSLMQATYGFTRAALKALAADGAFTYAAQAVPHGEMSKLMEKYR